MAKNSTDLTRLTARTLLALAALLLLGCGQPQTFRATSIHCDGPGDLSGKVTVGSKINYSANGLWEFHFDDGAIAQTNAVCTVRAQ